MKAYEERLVDYNPNDIAVDWQVGFNNELSQYEEEDVCAEAVERYQHDLGQYRYRVNVKCTSIDDGYVSHDGLAGWNMHIPVCGMVRG